MSSNNIKKMLFSFVRMNIDVKDNLNAEKKIYMHKLHANISLLKDQRCSERILKTLLPPVLKKNNNEFWHYFNYDVLKIERLCILKDLMQLAPSVFREI